jgi:hypothetical protein
MKINQYGMMEWDGFEPFFNDSEAILPQRRDRRCDGDDFLKPANPLKGQKSKFVQGVHFGLTADQPRNAEGNLQEGRGIHKNLESRTIIKHFDDPGVLVHPSGNLECVGKTIPVR